MSKRSRVGLCGVALITALGGCQGSTQQPDPNTDGWQHYMQFAAQATTQFCTGLSECCSAANFPFDLAACEAFNGPTWSTKFTTEVAAGSFYDRAAGQRCLNEIASSLQSCLVSSGVPLTDCDSVFVGFVPLGGRCDNDSKCAPVDGGEAACQVEGNTMSGVCVLNPPNTSPAHPQAGDACSMTCPSNGVCICADAACQSSLPACYSTDGLYCSDSGQCVPAGVPGDACLANWVCTAGTYCDAGQQCASLRALGSACTTSVQCQSGLCTGTCSPQLVASREFCVGKVPPPPH